MAAARTTLTECYYDVLCVPMEATDSEIRKAYRKSALKWHPDKNQHRIEEATARMKLITEAYSVLSDASERSWYDAHRESILSGAGAGGDGDDSSLVPNLFPFFSASCFGGFDDSEGGFFSVYSRAFDSVVRAERRHRPRTLKKPRPLPAFGSSESSWEDVSAFYRAWTNYSSDMLFAWADEHRSSDGANRITRRWMDRQNEKARHKAREEWTDRVQALAKYVRRRDPRVAKEAARVAELKAARARATAARKAEEAKALAKKSAELAEAAAEYRESLEAASGFRLADEWGDEPAAGTADPPAPAPTASASASSAVAAALDAPLGPVDDALDADADADATDDSALPSVPSAIESELPSSVASAAAAAAATTTESTSKPAVVTLEAPALSEDFREIAKGLKSKFNMTRDHIAMESTTYKAVSDADVIKELRRESAVPAAWSNADVMYAVETGRLPSERGKAQPRLSPEEEAEMRPKAEFVLVTAGSGRTGKAGRKKGKKPKIVACRVCGVEFPVFKDLLAHIDETGHRAAPKAAAEGSTEAGGEPKPASGAGKEAKTALGTAAGPSNKGKRRGEGKPSLTCGVCMEPFASKSKLFKHIQATGHALPKSEVAEAVATASETPSKRGGGGKGKRKKGKGRRKGQRGAGDSDDD